MNKIQAVIMAGGKGTRMGALTANTPKPMLKVGGKPVLQRLVEQLRDNGLSNIVISVNYLADQITDHFGDGSAFGVNIGYLPDNNHRTGSCGALLRIRRDRLCDSVYLLNGDILLDDADFSMFREVYRCYGSLNMVGYAMVDDASRFGVVEFEQGSCRVWKIEEKPVRTTPVYAGVCSIDSDRIIEMRGVNDNVTDFFSRIAKDLYVVRGVRVGDMWSDIGTPEDYALACAEYGGGENG